MMGAPEGGAHACLFPPVLVHPHSSCSAAAATMVVTHDTPCSPARVNGRKGVDAGVVQLVENANVGLGHPRAGAPGGELASGFFAVRH